MTAQIAEKLRYLGEDHAMFNNPLCDYFERVGKRPKFDVNRTSLWRGYVGHWEIIDQRLYLNRIKANLITGEAVTLEMVFPGYPERVFAHWYSGTLRLPKGECVAYVHGGYHSIYEQDLLLVIEQGLLLSTEIRTNTGPDGTATVPNQFPGFDG